MTNLVFMSLLLLVVRSLRNPTERLEENGDEPGDLGDPVFPLNSREPRERRSSEPRVNFERPLLLPLGLLLKLLLLLLLKLGVKVRVRVRCYFKF